MKRFNKKEAEAITINVVNNCNPFISLEDIVDEVRKELYNNFSATKATVDFINYYMRGIIHNLLNDNKREPITQEFAKEFISNVNEYFTITEAKYKSNVRTEKLKDLGI